MDHANRDLLATRNRQISEALHQAPVQHKLRRRMIRAVGQFPFAPLNKGWNRILFIKPDHLGDMLLAMPAIRALKEARPYVEVHVLASSAAANVLTNVQEVDQILTIDFPGFARGEKKENVLAPYSYLVRVSRQLRQIGYGSAVIMRPDHWWGAMLAHVAGINDRIGYALPDVEPFLTQALPFQHEHAVRQNMRLIEHWTGPVPDEEVDYHYEVYEDDRDYVDQYLQECGIGSKQAIFCIHPGAGTWVKRWEDSYWSQVADTLIDQLDAALVFTGSDSERSLIDRIQNRMQHKACTSAGDLRIEHLAALYARSRVVLGPDSGPMHLAAAVRTPTVSLFGPADPVEFGPWGDRKKHYVLSSTIACRPCRILDWADDDPANHPCMRDISVGQVLDAARRAVAEN